MKSSGERFIIVLLWTALLFADTRLHDTPGVVIAAIGLVFSILRLIHD